MSEGFSSPLVGGGGSLVYPAIKSPNFVAGSAGWRIAKDGSAEFNNVTIRNGTVISGTELFYNGTPALGNLYVSISAVAGTDSFGNAYKAGVWSYNAAAAVGETNGTQSTFLGVAGIDSHDPSMATDGLLIFFTGPGATGQPSAILESPNNSVGNSSVLVLAGRSQDGTKVSYAVLGQFDGTNLQAMDSIVVGRLGFGTAGVAASAQALKEFFSVVNGVINVQESSGLAGGVPAVQADHATFTVVATGTNQASKNWAIPAGDANADTVYRLTVWGRGTEGSTAQNLTVGIGLNGTAIRTVTAAALTASGAFRFKIEILLHVVTTGAGGTADVALEGSWATTASPAVSNAFDAGSQAAAGEAFNSTVLNNLELTLGWASATGAPTITSHGSMLERLGP